jgi:hypothetical protein
MRKGDIDMATCSITDPFVVDADTFYKAVETAKVLADEKRTPFFDTSEQSIKVTRLMPDEIKKVFNNV